jgi:hypothetical protein
MNNTVTINGSTFTGRNITVVNGQVIVDGVDRTPDSKNITISVTGDVSSLKVDVCNLITIAGNCGDVETVSGSVEVAGQVNGDVESVSGSIRCGAIAGKASTVSGNIRQS